MIYPPPLRGGNKLDILTSNVIEQLDSSNSSLSFQDDIILQENNIKNQYNPEEIFKKLCIKPVIWWIDIKANQEDIREKLRNKAGIYIIINMKTYNYYIGSAQTNNLYTRFRANLLTNKREGSTLVQKGVIKHGIDNFIYGILEIIPYKVNSSNNSELLNLENHYIHILRPAYNILTDTNRFVKDKNINLSDSTSDKLKTSNTIGLSDKLISINVSLTEDRIIYLNHIKNKITQEFKNEFNNKLSNIAKNRTKDYWSLEGLANIRKGSSKIIYISEFEDITNSYLCKFNSINQASHYLKCSDKTIQRALKIGYIFIPNLFIPLLNQEHIDKYDSIINYIDKSNLDIYKYSYKPNKYIKLKAGLSNYKFFTKFYISFILARTL